MKAWLLLALTLLAAIAVGACAGHDWATPADLWRAIEGDRDLRSRLLFDWRLPRVLAAALVGALLGLGGAIYQGVFRNPLAEPYLLGSAGGAALGATVALLVPLALPQSVLLPVLALARPLMLPGSLQTESGASLTLEDGTTLDLGGF